MNLCFTVSKRLQVVQGIPLSLVLSDHNDALMAHRGLSLCRTARASQHCLSCAAQIEEL